MKALKIVLLTLLVLVALVLLIGLLLPSRYRVSRSVEMRAPPEAVFAQLNTLQLWPEWTAWTVERYPDMKVSFSGPEAGVGAVWTWDGKETGHGTLQLIRSDPPRAMEYDLDIEHGKYLSKGTITVEPAGDLVTVTWVTEGDLGANPINRWFGLAMDAFMGPDLETGLNTLKQRVETK